LRTAQSSGSTLAAGSAARIIQLVDARDGSSRPMSDVLDERFTEAVVTAQPVTRRRLAAAEKSAPAGLPGLARLVVARYGGWKLLRQTPRAKTMAKGWQRFANTLAGLRPRLTQRTCVNPVAFMGRDDREAVRVGKSEAAAKLTDYRLCDPGLPTLRLRRLSLPIKGGKLTLGITTI